MALCTCSSKTHLWAWTISLLLLVMLDEHELHTRSDQEEESTNDSHGEACLLETAGGTLTDLVGDLAAEAIGCAERRECSKRCGDNSRTGVRRVSRQDGNCDHTANESNVEDLDTLAVDRRDASYGCTYNSEKCKDLDAAQTACEDYSCDSVEDSGT